MYQDPKERFYRIILAFLRQAEPPPTWRAIINALKSPIVNLTALAKRVEAAHFPDIWFTHYQLPLLEEVTYGSLTTNYHYWRK